MAKRLNLLGPSVGIRLIKFDGQVFSGEAAIQDSWSSVQSCKVRYPAIPSVHGVTSSAEGLGTAYSGSCRLWFTLSHGIINEIYCPTVDQPNTF